jgi:hypothetical protein
MSDVNPMPGAPVKAETGTKKKANGHTFVCVTDPEGYTVSLDMHTWQNHIAKDHPEMRKFEDLIGMTAEHPTLIQRGSGTTYYYYRLTGRSFYKANDVYLSLVVERNEVTKSGTVLTAHIVKEVRSYGETTWMSR